MKIKVLFLMLLSLLRFIVGVSLNGHQVPYSDDLAHGHEQSFGFHATPRKLIHDQKVESVEDKHLISNNEALSVDESREKGEDVEDALVKEMNSRVFTMDYGRVKRRSPVHNKFAPAATTSP